MIEVLSDSTPKARKEYDCMACDWINESWGYYNFTFSELRKIVNARKNGYKIKKGEVYINQRNIFDARFYTFRAIPEMHEICLKYNIYEAQG